MMLDKPIGRSKWQLDTPALCIDAIKLERNIAKMAEFVHSRGIALRPHAKTHKCPAIAWMQLRAGAIGITCAKVSEAEVMAHAGIQDLLVANQVVGPEKIARLVALAAYTRVLVAVDDADNAGAISSAAVARGVKVGVLLEIEVGMQRCGVAPDEPALALAQRVASLPGLYLAGIMGYEGHAVMIMDPAERARVAQEAMALLVATRDQLVDAGLPVEIVSAAGTGTFDITGNVAGITELQAGSYATMDTRYREVGAPFENALTILSRVLSATESDIAVTDAGLKTMTTEFGMPDLLGIDGWRVHSLVEEHGILHRTDGRMLRRGELVEFIPSHGCTTINLHDAFYVTRNDVVEAVWPISARGCVR
jgi:D-serine deaminase-like pyridoxal phosphate-dependent protein